jgi:TatD DNase family protein
VIDIHTHLYWKSYDEDREVVLLRAREAGVEKMLVIGCTVEESRQSVELAEQYPELWASVGVHPHFFNELVEKEYQIPNTKYQILTNPKEVLEHLIQELKSIAQSSKRVIAIGECGLDYFSHQKDKVITEDQKQFQKEGFLAQIELAQELKLPLIVHCRDAYEDMFSILQTTSYRLPAILHCYMGDTEVTQKFLALPNVYFSFTGNITYPVKKALIGTSQDLTETVKMLPLERIFVETDCPFLSPQEKRGERNEPAYVTYVAEKVAELQGVPVDAVEKATEENYGKVFLVKH